MILSTSTKTFLITEKIFVKAILLNEPLGSNQTISLQINNHPTISLAIPARGNINLNFENEEISQLYISFSGTRGSIILVYETSSPSNVSNVDLKNLEIFGFIIISLLIFFISFYIGQVIYNFLKRF
ncbi:MAG: hypothetical protein QXR88_02305 [Candidatus Pacearchaeota archaeon]